MTLVDLAGRLADQKIKNPMNNVTPDFSFMGMQFTHLWEKLLGGVWAIAILFVLGYALWGWAEFVAAKNDHHPDGMRASRNTLKKAGIGFAGLLAMPLLVGGFIQVFG